LQGVHTARVVAGCQQNTAGSLSLANDVTGCRSAQNTVLADQKLLDSICCTDLRDLLHNLRVIEAAITTDDEERALDTLGDGEENGGDEGLAVVWLLEDLDLLTKTRSTWPGTVSANAMIVAPPVLTSGPRRKRTAPLEPLCFLTQLRNVCL
jgi:hypothetical protein